MRSREAVHSMHKWTLTTLCQPKQRKLCSKKWSLKTEYEQENEQILERSNLKERNWSFQTKKKSRVLKKYSLQFSTRVVKEASLFERRNLRENQRSKKVAKLKQLQRREPKRTRDCLKEVQAKKSVRWMPWHQEPKKDAINCEKLRGAVNKQRSGGIRMWEHIRRRAVYSELNK